MGDILKAGTAAIACVLGVIITTLGMVTFLAWIAR